MLNPNRLIIPPKQGLTVNVFGDRFTIKVSGNETAQQWALFEVEVFPGQQTPRHHHQSFDEVYYLLAGELEIQVGSIAQAIHPGTLVQVPRNTPHQYQNISSEVAHFLTWVSPAGIETLFEALNKADPDQLKDAEMMAAMATQYDVFLN